MATPLDGLDKVGARKPNLLAFVLLQQIEAMSAAITADNTTVVAAMTAASGEATLEAAQGALTTAISDANTQAAARVAAINVEIEKLKDALRR
jgi:hypothetical protein